MPAVTEIWRHPIKAHGREQIGQVQLSQGQCLPWDRHWAVTHEQSRVGADVQGWHPCQEFSRGAKSPGLQAITARVETKDQRLTLSHPNQPDLTFDPNNSEDISRFVKWITPVSNDNRALPTGLIHAPGVAMTDTNFASISLINLATHRAVEAELEQKISPLRWRGNLLFDGLEAWGEMEWVGKTLRIGTAELQIKERITRCMATTANPETGERDADTLGALKSGWGHQDCGVYAVVTKSGQLCQGDEISVV